MVLVTGASGFVGQHLLRLLSAQGAPVRALYNRHQPDERLNALPGVMWQQCDLLDMEGVDAVMEGVDEVYHCAAIVSFSAARKHELLQVNVDSTANVVNAALDAGVRKMVHLSSVAALGRNPVSNIITEAEDWEESKRASVYGESKYWAELEVWRGMGEGLDAAIINPGIILGPTADWSAGSANLMKIVWDEFPFYTEGTTSWADVRDVVGIMHRLMKSAISDERYIVSSGDYSYKEIFTQMALALGKKPPRVKATPLMTEFVWRWSVLKHKLSGGEPTITRETARSAQKIECYDNGKLLAALPDFHYHSIADTIQHMADAFLAGKAK